MRFLNRFGDDSKTLHFVELALKGHLFLRPGLNQNVDGFVVTWAALVKRDVGGAEERGVAATQPALEPPSREDVGFRNLSGQTHWIFEGKREQGDAKTNALCALGRGAEKCQRIGRDGKFLKEMMVDHGVDIEADLVGVFDLTKDFPSHLGVGFTGRRLHFCVDAESHVLVLAPWFRSRAERFISALTLSIRQTIVTEYF